MEFKAAIGLEIHVALKTKSKMFSASPNYFSHEPNTHVTVYDMAHPGTMPTVNAGAVRHGIRLAHALHMDIDPLLRFDRKCYFYPDSPKGFQITQQFHPLGRGGFIEIECEDGGKKTIGLKRLHLEEDACKMFHRVEDTLLDYNRVGVPLVEIVSLPELSSGRDAARFVEAIRHLVVYALASDGKMEDGSLRCDVNVSIAPRESDALGTKVEIKNLNSLRNIERAIDQEILRQSELLRQGMPIEGQTRRYDEASGSTKLMRSKAEAVDYRYVPEANIVPIRLSEAFIAKAIEECPELYERKWERYLKLGISAKDADVILYDVAMAQYFDKVLACGASTKAATVLFNVEVQASLHKMGKSIVEFPLEPKRLAELASMQEQGYPHQAVVQAFHYLLEHPKSTLEEARLALSLTPPTQDEEGVLELVRQILDENPQSIADYKAGKDRAMGFLVGKAIQAAKGRYGPSDIAKAMKEELGKK